ncbi:MAG: hypothetical protein A4E45_00075 [Methanosaeta sp. PtaB.Bin039]|nr:MAG: hypothetical protein A4E45_00075 [Methanosaeta sp. PtaB.Bin039]OPY47609.1 MAG: hypothetical protein A4E47_00203 [Methanosaeta sp. PtaU1.Bin028]HOT06886.1 hypothetical protein [Methanotrichaceae archaeon]HQF16492.1 hypothetical protein [Methanotrichaceae archaeon]HQI91915.1 hypothetical protein [Methanotrichaceae archaeon]
MKIRIEIDENGLKSTLEIESQGMESVALRERIIDYLNASGVFSDQTTHQEPVRLPFEAGATLMERIESFIRFEFPQDWFTTQELRERYEMVCDDIKLSTVSTYLSRMNRDGLLERRGNRNNRQYRMLRPSVTAVPIGSGKRNQVEDRIHNGLLKVGH